MELMLLMGDNTGENVGRKIQGRSTCSIFCFFYTRCTSYHSLCKYERKVDGFPCVIVQLVSCEEGRTRTHLRACVIRSRQKDN